MLLMTTDFLFDYAMKFLKDGIIGGSVLGLISILLLFFFTFLAAKLKWPKDSSAGKVTRILFVVYCFLMIPVSAAINGFCWGIMNAAKKEVVSGEIQEKFSEPITQGIANLYIRSQQVAKGREVSEEEFQQELSVFLEQGGKIDIEELQSSVKWVASNVDQIEELLVTVAQNEVGASEESAYVTKIISSVIEEQISKKSNIVKGEIMGVIPKIMESVGNGDQEISCQEVSLQVTRSYIVPQLESQITSYSYSFIVWSNLTLIGTFVIPFVIIHFIFVFIKMGSKNENVE